MKLSLPILMLAASLWVTTAASAQQASEALGADTAAERAQQGTQAYNPAVPQGCDAVEQGYCIKITKERDVEVPPEGPARTKQER